MSTVLPAESATPAKAPPGPFPIVTAALIAATLVGFAIELIRGFSFDGDNATLLVSLGGNQVYRTLGGEPWRLVTSLFLSGGVLWLVMVLIFLAQLRHAERVFGRLGYLAIWLAGGLLSGLAFDAHAAPNVVTAGGSGGIFAMYGAYLAFLYLQRKRFDKVAMSSNLRTIGLFLAINIVFTLGVPNADPMPLLAGILSGAAIGAGLVFGSPNHRTVMIRAALGLVVTLAVAAATLYALPARSPVGVNPKLGACGPLVAALHELERQTAAERPDVREAMLPKWTALRDKLATTNVPNDQRPLLDAMKREVETSIALLGVLVKMEGDEAWASEHGPEIEAAIDTNLQASQAVTAQENALAK